MASAKQREIQLLRSRILELEQEGTPAAVVPKKIVKEIISDFKKISKLKIKPVKIPIALEFLPSFDDFYIDSLMSGDTIAVQAKSIEVDNEDMFELDYDNIYIRFYESNITFPEITDAINNLRVKIRSVISKYDLDQDEFIEFLNEQM